MRKPIFPWPPRLDRHPVGVRDGLLIPGFAGAWEEPGWRGYAVPRLQSGRTALRAALILGLLIAGWHLPLIVVGQVSWTDMIQIMGAVIVFNWLFNNARGSVLIIMLAHADNNTVWSTLTSKVVAEPDLAQQAVLQAAVWCVTAMILVLLAGPADLSRRHTKQEEPRTLRTGGEKDVPVRRAPISGADETLHARPSDKKSAGRTATPQATDCRRRSAQSCGSLTIDGSGPRHHRASGRPSVGAQFALSRIRRRTNRRSSEGGSSILQSISHP